MAVSVSNKFERRRALAYWLMANKVWMPAPEFSIAGHRKTYFNSPTLFSEADRMIDRIGRGELDPFDSANRMIDFMREQNRSTSTICGTRSHLLRFLRYSRLGLDPDDISVSVKKFRRVSVIASRLPTKEQVRGLLLVVPLKVKVLISMLVSTGGRIGEVRRVRVSDIDFKTSPVYVHFRETKTGVHRIGFLCSETVELLRHYLNVRRYQHEYIFDGYDNREGGKAQPLDKPLSHTSAWHSINRGFLRLQMDERSDGVHHYYHPHVFRTLSLALLKTGGYPSDWAEYLVGHSIGTHAAYLPPITDLAREWLKLEDRFCFLSSSPTLERPETITIATSPSTIEASRFLKVKSEPTSEDAQKVPTPPNSSLTHRWASKSWHYVKTTLDSVDYDQAVAEGYAIFDRDASWRVLRKRWVPMSS